MFDKGICEKSSYSNITPGIHERRVYNLKHTNMQDKQWVCRQVKKGCRGSIHTNLDVDAVFAF
ncbi:hypothetical protein T12_5319 [Trichinella patagoniensis]|uniref:FLYWCH-type domain-containing protein n=1 Tax=Trichinella patagoniensis TaxID=990121 RepID=A0A0V0Z212_9BILA|nr:hypothetical protein T12_8540 [Trichinella patagoniensis]KRY06599.1 hypothetical protein T12_5319 [Trichinella patagoniensis]